MSVSFASRLSALALAAFSFALPAAAKDAASPDWPCVWRKVVTIDAATIWDGPALDGAKNWMNDDTVRKLSAYVISRRLKTEEVEDAIKEAFPDAEVLTHQDPAGVEMVPTLAKK